MQLRGSFEWLPSAACSRCGVAGECLGHIAYAYCRACSIRSVGVYLPCDILERVRLWALADDRKLKYTAAAMSLKDETLRAACIEANAAVRDEELFEARAQGVVRRGDV